MLWALNLPPERRPVKSLKCYHQKSTRNWIGYLAHLLMALVVMLTNDLSFTRDLDAPS